jgi:DHA1 family bicyclomycin/chloramphenicol resistance-like MFS transporter
LILAIMISPLFAPSVGGEVLHLTTWHGIFVVLAVVGALVSVAAAFGLPETLPAGRRRRGGVREAASSMRSLVTEREFASFAVPACLMSGATFAYISGSSFVFQEVYGVSPQVYGYLFALNGAALVVSSQVNRFLVGRFSPYRLMRFGLLGGAAAALALLAVAVLGPRSLVALIAPLVGVISCFGFVAPNSNALALSAHGDEAGAGSALLGALRFAAGAAAAPLVGLAGSGTALPMVAVMVSLALAANAAFVALGRRPRGEVEVAEEEEAAAA